MMTKIIRELTIKKTNEINSQQIIFWTRRVKAQRAQKTILDTTKERKEFDALKRHDGQNNATDSTKRGTKLPLNNSGY